MLRCDRGADLDCILLAGRYTLLDRSGETLLARCAELGVSVIVGGVFNSGLLAAPMAGATFDYAAVPSHVLRQAQRLQAVSEDFEVALPAAALQFVSRNLAVTRILFGARSAGEVEADVDFATARIDPDLWPALEIARR